MSKSNGAILTVSVLEEKGYDPLAFRFMCLNSHYRKQLVFSYDALEQAQNTLNKLRTRIANISKDGELDKVKFDEYNNRFKENISDDVNTANALTVLYDLLKDDTVNNTTKLELISNFDKVFDVNLIKSNEVDEELLKYINEKIEERKQAKINKDFELADKVRNELLEKGIQLKDTREGTTFEIL
jgi:cysteinyl-tRNA synthetase